MEITLADNLPGCKNFYWSEALWLKMFQFHAMPSIEQIRHIVSIGLILESIRNIWSRPITVNSWLRPPFYNSHRLVEGAEFSWHQKGGAVDFSVSGVSCDEVRKVLKGKLDFFDIRMEDLPGSNWVHIDNKEPGPVSGRLFKP